MTVELEESLSPPEVANEATRLISDFRTRHPYLTSFRGKRTQLLWEESPGRKSLIASRTTNKGVESVILVTDEERGGVIHYFEQSRIQAEPDVYGHTQTGIEKVRRFLESFSHDLLNQPNERRKNPSKKRSHREGSFIA